jgi:hypothetical protein
VASLLRKELDVPVFEDTRGDFVDNYSQYLPFINVLILFDAKGRAIDAMIPNTSNEQIPPSLPEVLLEFGLLK